MLKQETRVRLQDLLLSPHIQSFSIDDSKDREGNIYTVVRIHAYGGTLIEDVMLPIASIFRDGVYGKSSVIGHDPGDFVSTNFINDECIVYIFTSIKRLPAQTESNEEFIHSQFTTDTEVQTNA